MDFLTIFGFIVVVAFIIGSISGIIEYKNTSNKKESLLSEIEKLDDFEVSQHIMGDDGESGLAVDELRHKICLIKQKNGKTLTKVYTYRSILETEILENGLSLTKTSRGSQLGGILIGGLLLGGVGAIIGGLSGKKSQIDKVNSIDLKIVINDMQTPMFLINFLKSSNGYKKDSFVYKSRIESIRRWNSLLAVLIKKADEEDIKNEKDNG